MEDSNNKDEKEEYEDKIQDLKSSMAV